MKAMSVVVLAVMLAGCGLGVKVSPTVGVGLSGVSGGVEVATPNGDPMIGGNAEAHWNLGNLINMGTAWVGSIFNRTKAAASAAAGT